MATKILVVEDDGIFASILRIKLKNWGYEVPKIVLTGHEAIKHMKNIDPDLVIMNIFLKGKLDGIETARLIDAEFKTPIIYCSAKNDEELSNKIKNLPNRDYIPKKCADEHLKLTIENNLRKSNSNINKIKSTSNDEKLVENPQNDIKIMHDHRNDVLMHSSKNMVTTKSTKENKSLLKKVKNSQSYGKINSSNRDLEPLTSKNPKKDKLYTNYVNLSHDNENNTGISLSKSSDEYLKTPQNLEIYGSKASNKVASHEIEIKKLENAEYINSMHEKDEKIQELEKHQRKLEEILSIYKKQRIKILNEIYSLKKQMDTFISILDG